MSDPDVTVAEGDAPDDGPRYRWTFDKRGREIQPDTGAGPRLMFAPPVLESRDATEPERVLEWLIRHPDSGVDLELLERMQVLPSPPSWRFVRTGIERLRGDTPPVDSARVEIDDAMQTWMTNARANARPLETAAYCAMALSKFVPGEPGPALRRGLEILEQTLQRGKDRPERLVILERVGRAMADLAPREPLANVAGFLDTGRVEAWLDALPRIREAVVASVGQDAWDVSRRAWEYWRLWATGQWPSPPPSTEPCVWNMASRAAGWLPGAILKDDPTAMSIAEWTTAFRRALHEDSFHLGEIRGWFIPLALAQLAFPEQALTYLARATQEPPPDIAALKSRIASATHGPSCLILSLEPDTVATRWRPSTTIGCLAAEPVEMAEVVRDLLEVSVNQRPSISYLFVGVKGVPTDVQQSQGIVHAGELRERFFQGQAVRIVFVGGEPRARGVNLSAPYLENPATLDEAVQYLNRLPQNTWRES